MSAQTLDRVAEEPIPVIIPDRELIDAVLSYHDGDHRAAIRTLLADAAHLRGELYVASQLVSKGMSRGWMPTYERPDETPTGN